MHCCHCCWLLQQWHHRPCLSMFDANPSASICFAEYRVIFATQVHPVALCRRRVLAGASMWKQCCCRECGIWCPDLRLAAVCPRGFAILSRAEEGRLRLPPLLLLLLLLLRWMDKILHDPQHDNHVIVSSRAPRTPLISTLPEWVGDAGHAPSKCCKEANVKLQGLQGMTDIRKAMQDFVHQQYPELSSAVASLDSTQLSCRAQWHLRNVLPASTCLPRPRFQFEYFRRKDGRLCRHVKLQTAESPNTWQFPSLIHTSFNLQFQTRC